MAGGPDADHSLLAVDHQPDSLRHKRIELQSIERYEDADVLVVQPQLASFVCFDLRHAHAVSQRRERVTGAKSGAASGRHEEGA